MRTHTWLGALAALALVGCAGETMPDPDPTFATAPPDFAGLAMDLAGDDGSKSDGTSQDALAEDAPMLLPIAQGAVRPLNQVVAFIFRKVDALVAEKPVFVEEGNETWQKDIDGITWQLFVQREKAGDNAYFVTVGALPRGVAPGGADNSATLKIARCDIVLGKNTPHRGQGHVDIDLAQLRTLYGESFTSAGRIELTFNHENGSKRLHAKLTNFKTKSMANPLNAVFAYTKAPSDAGGAVRLAAYANVNDPADNTRAAPEWLLVQGRWLAGFKARFDAVAFSGDFGPNAWARSVECLDTQDKAAFARTVYRDPTNPAEDQRTVVWRNVGTVDACAEKLRADPDPAVLPDDFEQAKLVAADETTELLAPTEIVP